MKKFLFVLPFVLPAIGFAQRTVTTAVGPTQLTRALVGTWSCQSEVEANKTAGTKIEIEFSEGLSEMSILRDKKVSQNAQIEELEVEDKPSHNGTNFIIHFSSGNTDEEANTAFWLGKLSFSISADLKTLGAGEFHQGYVPWVNCTKRK